MAGYYITRSGIWLRQPTLNVGINENNPICRGLVYAINPAFSVVSYSGSATRITTENGVEIQNTTGTASAGIVSAWRNTSGGLIGASTARSALIVANVNTFANAPYYYAGLRDSTDSETAYAALIWSNSTTAIGFSWSSGFRYKTAPAAGKVIVSGSVAGSGLVSSARVCINGNLGVSDTATQDGTPPAQSNSGIINIGGRTTDSLRSLNGSVSLVAFWNRELSEQEHISLYQNPWQIFKPQQRRIWVPVNISGSLIMSADAGNYIITGQTSSYNLTASMSSGSYDITGTNASFDTSISTAAGSYSITGSTAVFDTSLVLSTGSYVITGSDADLSVSGATGSTVLQFTGISNVDGVTGHSGISKPRVELVDAGGGTYTVSLLPSVTLDDSVSDTTFLVDGALV